MRSSAGSWSSVLPREFYARHTEQVARELLGAYLVHRIGNRVLAGKIVETEAYLGLADRAAHAWHGVTDRTQVIFGPPGHAYVYLIYGMYECLNLVAEPADQAGCVLIRALEPVLGLAEMRRRRPGVKRLENLASGPGKLTLAMGITRRHNGQDVTRGPLVVRRAADAGAVPVEVTTRVGIRHCADWPLRFYIRGN
ncbi:MAG TPA: DNA-3-methyladenine glycosylase, partial [Bryobacterales bacterium]|nr:DNA-3-methyladenine glycosylase [Bryobacterales bacterium]